MKFILCLFALTLVIINPVFSNEFWITSNGNDGNKFSPLKDIDKKNISTLTKVWEMHTGYIPSDSMNNQATPIFVEGVLVTKGLNGKLFGINPASGKKLWELKIPSPFAIRGYSFNKGSVYISTKNGIYIVDVASGSLNKSIGLSGVLGNSFSALPPVFEDDNVISANYNGTVESFNRQTGGLNWSTSLYKDNVVSRIWSGLTIDKVSKIVYVVTSNANGLLSNGSLEGGYSCSLIAINARDGKVLWAFKEIKNDVWDLDVVGAPLLVDVKGSNLRAVIAVTKSGNTIFLNGLTGKPIFKNSIKKINTPNFSDIPNQKLSQTQIEIIRPEKFSSTEVPISDFLKLSKSGNDFVEFKIRNAKFEKFTPVSLKNNVILYGLHGGAEWPGASFDKSNNSIIVPSNRVPWILRAQYKLASNVIFPKNLVSEYYIDKCSACHGNKLEGKYLTEVDGDEFFPSLLGISTTRDAQKILDLKNFKFNHKYLDKNHLSDKRIDQIYKLMGLNIENRWKLKLHKVIGIKFSVYFGLIPGIDEVQQNIQNVNQEHISTLFDMYKKIDGLLTRNNMIEVDAFWQPLLDENLLPLNNPPWGYLTSINLDSGKLNWKVPFGNTPYRDQPGDLNFGGVLTTASGVIFATGARDNYARAYDNITGIKLWEALMPAAGSSPPMTYKHGGCQYVVFNASGGRWPGYTKPSDSLVAYTLNGCKSEK